METRKEMQDRNSLFVKRGVIAGTESSRSAVDNQPQLPRVIRQGLDPEWRRPRSIHGELVFAQTANHIEIQHRHGLVHGNKRIADVTPASIKPQLFTAEGDKQNASRQPFVTGDKLPGDFHQDGRSRRVIVGPVMNGVIRSVRE